MVDGDLEGELTETQWSTGSVLPRVERWAAAISRRVK